ncbi:glycosyltransferase [Janthinobacterium sp.]|uniref:glycosyltransferase family 32 protein n=1 Tax=Janthinobacterium sp. TaxID=1871054 RepID=UPI00289A63EC|nr:glycosyltransferase [Janthinobacterium sp.]
MIPKKIHYCWFGDNSMSVLNQRCIASWQRLCPDYELIMWNESNSDIDNEYCRQAIKQKKWAFVSDWVRFDVLHRHGGIYLDTDVELIRTLDGLLGKEALLAAYESAEIIGTAFIAAPAAHPAIDASRQIVLGHLTALRKFATSPRILKQGMEQVGMRGCDVLPSQVFFPFNPFDDGNARNAGQLMYEDVGAQTLGIHHYAMSWSFDKETSLVERIRNKLRRRPDWRLTVAF